MKSLKNMTGDSLEQMIDYSVLDQNGETIGTLHSLWSDPTTGGVEFLGVKTGWLFGHNHVVPAEKAELDEAGGVVRLPYTEAFIKEAPSMPADSEISELEEDNIYQYYGLASPTHAEGDLSILEASKAAALTGEADAGVARWRRTSREEEPKSGAVSDLYDISDMNPATANNVGGMPPTFSTNMMGASSGTDAAVGLDADAAPKMDAGGHTNADPITGEPGAHPIGTGIGAVSAGVTGAAIGGAVGGPIGAPIGAAIGGLAGAIGGGLAGKGVAEVLNPTAENAFWAAEYQKAPYFEKDYEYTDYAPAYRVGYEGFGQYGATGREYADVETDLEKQYATSRGSSRLGWDKATAASRDAWNRLKEKFQAVK